MIKKIPKIKKVFRQILKKLPGAIINLEGIIVKITFNKVSLQSQLLPNTDFVYRAYFSGIWDVISKQEDLETLAKILKVLNTLKGTALLQPRSSRKEQKEKLDRRKNGAIGFRIMQSVGVGIANTRFLRPLG